MVISPQHFSDVVNGYEKTTSGLWTHKGNLTVTGHAAFQGDAIYNVANYYSGNWDTAFAQAWTNAKAGGTLHIPAGDYTLSQDWLLDLITLQAPLTITGYGARLRFTSAGSYGIHLTTNVNVSSVLLEAWRRVSIRGLWIIGTAQANSGLYLDGACSCHFTDLVIDGYTATAEGKGSVLFFSGQAGAQIPWAEENEFHNLRIENCGNGITFTSGTQGASLENNHFYNTNIDVKQPGGSGIRARAANFLTLARCLFVGTIVHVFADNVTAFNLGNAYTLGSGFYSPSIDIFGAPANPVGFNYSGADGLLVVDAVAFGTGASQAMLFSGGGAYLAIGQNTFFRPLPNGWLQLSNTTPSVGQTSSSAGVLFVNGRNVGGTLDFKQMELRGEIDPDDRYRLLVLNSDGTKVLTANAEGDLVLPVTGSELFFSTLYRGLKQPYTAGHHLEHSPGPIAGPASLAPATNVQMAAINFTRSFTVQPAVSASVWSASGVGAPSEVMCAASATLSAITITLRNIGTLTATGIFVSWLAVGQDQ